MNIAVAYGTTTTNGVLTAAQTWGTYANLKTSRPKFCAWAEAKGITQAEALKAIRYEIDIREDMQANTRAFVDATMVIGVFKCTMPFDPKFQKFKFAGPAAYSGTGYVTGGTELQVDHTNWNTRLFPSRSIFLCNDWGTSFTGVGTYAEGLSISDVSLNGGLPFATSSTIEGYGIACRLSGSNTTFTNIKSDNFPTAGFAWAGGTPIHGDNLRSFYCGKYGFDFQGTSGSEIFLTGLECDDPGVAMFNFQAGWGMPGGGTGTIMSAKMEAGHNGHYAPAKFAIIKGSFSLCFVAPHIGLQQVVSPVAFDLDASNGAGGNYNSGITVSDFFECGSTSGGKFSQMVKTPGQNWAMPGSGNGNSCRSVSFGWTNIGGMYISISVGSTYANGTAAPTAPLAMLIPVDMGTSTTCAAATVNRDGVLFGSVASGSLIDVPSNCPAPVDPYTYYAWGQWGSCKNGKQTRKRYQVETKACP